MPDQLPATLTSLLDQLEHDAKSQGLTADRDTLKTVLASSPRAHHIGKGGELDEAFNRVA